MTRRIMFSLAAALAIGACSDAPTSNTDAPRPEFITGNFQADHEHTWVGLVVFYLADGTPSHRCSGSLLSDQRTFLTAGHCIPGVASARIWFAQDAGAGPPPRASGYPFTCGLGPCVFSTELHNYGYFAGFPNTHDVGVVILGAPFTGVGTGTLADAGTLEALAKQRGLQNVTFVSSGYGLNEVKPRLISLVSRMQATSKLVNLNSSLTDGFNVQTSANPGGGRGGTCFGDSGGPLLYQGKIVGVTSFGLNANCKGVDFAYRVDREEVQDWISDPTQE